jgi:hypothetical protein
MLRIKTAVSISACLMIAGAAFAPLEAQTISLNPGQLYLVGLLAVVSGTLLDWLTD